MTENITYCKGLTLLSMMQIGITVYDANLSIIRNFFESFSLLKSEHLFIYIGIIIKIVGMSASSFMNDN